MMRRPLPLAFAATALLIAGAGGCRIESTAPGASAASEAPACAPEPSGELWVYTSMYRQVIDQLQPLLEARMPAVTFHWYQAGSEKVAGRVEAERSAGAVRADVIATSDPFLYARLATQSAFVPYVSPHALRIPRSLLDLEGRWASARLSTMVIAFRKELEDPPRSFEALTLPRWKGRVALGDPLVSGTAFTWAVFLEQKYGADYFGKLRENEAMVAGGNSAVQQKVESGEADVGVLLLENVLMAQDRGSPIAFLYPEDGAILVPGPVAIFSSTRNPTAARAFVDVLLSPEGQRIMVEGDMHSVDPRLGGPNQEQGLAALLERSQDWTDQIVEAGVERGTQIKDAFSQAFSR